MTNLSLLTKALLFFSLKGGTEELFMCLTVSVRCDLIVIYLFEEIHQNPHVGLDLVTRV